MNDGEKTIFLVGFQGIGFLNPSYQHEDSLILAGHVGIAFEQTEPVFGFHPTQEAINALGGYKEALRHLIKRRPIDGSLFDDTPIFYRAYELHMEDGISTDVWQLPIVVPVQEFDTIRSRTMKWMQEVRLFPYTYPPAKGAMPDHVDNCATFPRKLGLPVPEPTGRLKYFKRAIKAIPDSSRWHPVA